MLVVFAKLSRVESASENTSNGESPEVDQTSVYRPTPDNPPWNNPIAVAVWIASVLAILLVPMVFVLPYAISSGPAFSDKQAFGAFFQQDPVAIFLQLIAIIPAHTLTIALAWVIVTKRNRFSFRETLGWESGGMKWRDYVGILVVFFAVLIVVGNYFPEQENEMTRILRSSRWAVFLIAFIATFTAPIVEEVIYRGILYSTFQRTLGVGAAVASVTLLFALVHVPQYYPSYSTIVLLLLLSLILTLIRVRTGNLLPCIVLHTVFNATQSILLILEPYLNTPSPAIEPVTSLILK